MGFVCRGCAADCPYFYDGAGRRARNGSRYGNRRGDSDTQQHLRCDRRGILCLNADLSFANASAKVNLRRSIPGLYELQNRFLIVRVRIFTLANVERDRLTREAWLPAKRSAPHCRAAVWHLTEHRPGYRRQQSQR